MVSTFVGRSIASSLFAVRELAATYQQLKFLHTDGPSPAQITYLGIFQTVFSPNDIWRTASSQPDTSYDVRKERGLRMPQAFDDSASTDHKLEWHARS